MPMRQISKVHIRSHDNGHRHQAVLRRFRLTVTAEMPRQITRCMASPRWGWRWFGDGSRGGVAGRGRGRRGGPGGWLRHGLRARRRVMAVSIPQFWFASDFAAEIGVGVVHARIQQWSAASDEPVGGDEVGDLPAGHRGRDRPDRGGPHVAGGRVTVIEIRRTVKDAALAALARTPAGLVLLRWLDEKPARLVAVGRGPFPARREVLRSEPTPIRRRLSEGAQSQSPSL
jgi:hypothetical protein